MTFRECRIYFNEHKLFNTTFDARSHSILSKKGAAISWDYSAVLYDPYTDFNITIHNMEDYTVQELSRSDFNEERTRVRIQAEGYNGERLSVATGEVYWVDDTRRIGMRETLFRCTNLLKNAERETVNVELSAGTTFDTAFKQILGDRLGVNYLDKSIAVETLPSKYVARGTVIKVLIKLCKANALSINITNGQAVFAKRHPSSSLALTPSTFVLSPDSGLVDYPYRLDWNNWKITSLFNPSLFPGQWISVYSPGAGGAFAIPPVLGGLLDNRLYIVGVDHMWDDTEASTVLKLVENPSRAYDEGADNSL